MKTITHDGKTLTLPQWSAATGIPEPTIRARLRRNMSPGEALSASKPAPSKTEARRYLNDLPPEQRPKSLAKLLPAYKGKQWGVAVSEAHRPLFDRWYEKEFVPANS